MQTIPVALIGCGMSARTFHLPLIRANPAFCLSALVSSREQTDIAVPQYRDTGAMLANSDAEAVIITAPNAVHFSLAQQCLAAGKHVVLEKPMVNSVAEGQALIALAAEKRRLLTVFHNRRWDSDFLTVKRLLANRDLGELRLYSSQWNRFRPEVRNRWRENAGAGAGIWYDLGSHLLDQALHLFGLPQAVSGHCRALRPGSPSVDYAHVQLHYGSFEAILHTSPYGAAPNARFYLEGTAGSYRKNGLDQQENQLKAGIHPDDPTYGTENGRDDGILYHADGSEQRIPALRGNFPAYYHNLAAALRGEVPPAVSAEEALRVVYLTELAQQSSNCGQRLAVDLAMFRGGDSYS